MLFLGVLLYHVYQVVLELATSNRALLRQTRIDELTGLLNRRGFNANLEEQWRHSKRTRRPLSLLKATPPLLCGPLRKASFLPKSSLMRLRPPPRSRPASRRDARPSGTPVL